MPRPSFKSKLDKYVTDNYDYLLAVSRNITSRKHNQEYNLLHEVIIVLYTKLENKQNTFLESNDTFRKFTIALLKNYYVWERNRRFNTKQDNHLFTYQPSYEEGFNEQDFYIEEQSDKNAEDLIYIEAENTNEITKLFLKDLNSNDIPIDQGLMVNKIIQAGNQLTGVEKEIFDMYYLQEIDCLSIHKELKRTNKKTIPYYKILAIQKTVRQKIIDKIKC